MTSRLFIQIIASALLLSHALGLRPPCSKPRSLHYHPQHMLKSAMRRNESPALYAVNIFDSQSAAETAKLVVVNLIGLGLYVLLQLVAPKIGLVDETEAKEGYKDGEEPWNL